MQLHNRIAFSWYLSLRKTNHLELKWQCRKEWRKLPPRNPQLPGRRGISKTAPSAAFFCSWSWTRLGTGSSRRQSQIWRCISQRSLQMLPECRGETTWTRWEQGQRFYTSKSHCFHCRHRTPQIRYMCSWLRCPNRPCTRIRHSCLITIEKSLKVVPRSSTYRKSHSNCAIKGTVLCSNHSDLMSKYRWYKILQCGVYTQSKDSFHQLKEYKRLQKWSTKSISKCSRGYNFVLIYHIFSLSSLINMLDLQILRQERYFTESGLVVKSLHQAKPATE